MNVLLDSTRNSRLLELVIQYFKMDVYGGIKVTKVTGGLSIAQGVELPPLPCLIDAQGAVTISTLTVLRKLLETIRVAEPFLGDAESPIGFHFEKIQKLKEEDLIQVKINKEFLCTEQFQ